MRVGGGESTHGATSAIGEAHAASAASDVDAAARAASNPRRDKPCAAAARRPNHRRVRGGEFRHWTKLVAIVVWQRRVASSAGDEALNQARDAGREDHMENTDQIHALRLLCAPLQLLLLGIQSLRHGPAAHGLQRARREQLLRRVPPRRVGRGAAVRAAAAAAHRRLHLEVVVCTHLAR